jgi:ribulose-phosphate 3-epimerase
MPQISASLLAADTACLGDQVRLAEEAGVDSFHFDMMDGHYVPNLALTPDQLAALRAYSGLPFQVHLELANPDELLNHFPQLGADLIIVCRDTLAYPQQTFKRIRAMGAQVGLSLRPQESIVTAQALFPALDVLLILGVAPGFGGQALLPNTPQRIAQARELCAGLANPPLIAVDGGVNLDNAPGLVQTGAQMLIIGTALFKAAQMGAFVAELKAAAQA